MVYRLLDYQIPTTFRLSHAWRALSRSVRSHACCAPRMCTTLSPRILPLDFRPTATGTQSCHYRENKGYLRTLSPDGVTIQPPCRHNLPLSTRSWLTYLLHWLSVSEVSVSIRPNHFISLSVYYAILGALIDRILWNSVQEHFCEGQYRCKLLYLT